MNSINHLIHIKLLIFIKKFKIITISCTGNYVLMHYDVFLSVLNKLSSLEQFSRHFVLATFNNLNESSIFFKLFMNYFICKPVQQSATQLVLAKFK